MPRPSACRCGGSIRGIDDRIKLHGGTTKIISSLMNRGAYAPHSVQANAAAHWSKAAKARPALKMKQNGLRAVVRCLCQEDSTTAVTLRHRLQRGVSGSSCIGLAGALDRDSGTTERKAERARDPLDGCAFIAGRLVAAHAVIHVCEKDGTVPKSDGKPCRIGAS